MVAGLSFLFPGLGQAALGKYRRGAIMALPALVLGLTLVLIAIFDRSALYQMLSSNFLVSMLILDFVALLYHLWAMADGYLLAVRFQPLGPGVMKLVSRAVVFLVFASAVTIHVGFASVDLQAQQTLGCVMNPNGPCIADIVPGESLPTYDPGEDDEDTPDTSTSGPVATDTPSLTPADTGSMTPGDTTAYPVPPACTGAASTWAASKCTLYILLIGGDAGTGRGGNGAGKLINLRTDTMILLQVDLSTGRAAMYGIPRNLMNVPLGKTDWNAYPNHVFAALRQYGAPANLYCGGPPPQQVWIFNAMWVDAAFANPSKYPYPGDYFARATKAVEDSVSALMGVPVNGAVVVDLSSFVELVNALAPHGLQINSPYRVVQVAGTNYYNSAGRLANGQNFPAGVQTLNGEQVLAYARLRHVVGHDSDYYRMARQELVLNSLLSQVSPCEVALNITNVLSAVKDVLWTDVGTWSDAPALAAIAAKITTRNVKSYQLTPSNGYNANIFPNNMTDQSVLQVYQAAVKKGLNGVASAYASGSAGSGGGGGGGGFHC